MEDTKEDIKKHASLPPNYVSLAQLQQRWIQQQQQKQKEQEQKEEIALENQQQLKQKKGFNRNGRISKNDEGGIHVQDVHVRQNGGRRGDAHRLYVPPPKSDGNHREIWEAKSEFKSEKLELRARGDGGGKETENAMYKKKKKYNKKKRRTKVKKGLNGEDPTQTLTENGGMSGVLNGKDGGKEGYSGNVQRSSYENERVQEFVDLVPEVEGKEVNSVGSSRNSRGKQVVNNQFSSSAESWSFEAKSLGKKVVDGQFSSSTDDRRVEGKCRAMEAVNDQFLSNTDDRGVEGSLNEYMADVLPEDTSEEEISTVSRGRNGRKYNAQLKRSGNNKGLVEEGNVCMLEGFQDNEAEEEVPGPERRKTGKERLTGRFQGNEGNWRMNGNSNDDKLPLEVSQRLVKEGVFTGQKERNGFKARTGRGVPAYGNQYRVSSKRGPKIVGYFGDLSLSDSRNGSSGGGQRLTYGKFGRFASLRTGKQADGALVWVKKEEKSDTNPAEIS